MKTTKSHLGKAISMLMVMALMICAYAVNTSAATATTQNTAIQITKNLTQTQAEANLDNVTFSYSLTAAGMSDTPASVTVQPVAGNATFTISGADFTGDTTSKQAVKEYNPGLSFTEVGVYDYILKETTGTAAGFTYDKSEYKVSYQVTKDFAADDTGDTLKVIQTITKIKDEAGQDIDVEDQQKVPPVFNNSQSTSDITVLKTVTGDMGDKNADFSFSITLNDQNTQIADYTYFIYNEAGVQESDGINIGRNIKFRIKARLESAY